MRMSFGKVLTFGLPIVFTIFLSYYLQSVIVTNQDSFTRWLASFGPYIIAMYIILQALTIIIAPIGGYFLLVAMIALYGPATALILNYLVATPCFVFNFYLARKYGRPLVTKVIGQTALKSMDKFVQNAGLTLLVIFRLFQSSNFDYFSYAFGLTSISLKTFTVVNLLIGIPAALVAFFIYSSASSLTQGVVLGYIVGFIFSAIAILSSVVLRRRGNI